MTEIIEQILSAQPAPAAHESGAVFSLVLFFLTVEIPLVFSIYMNDSKNEDPRNRANEP